MLLHMWFYGFVEPANTKNPGRVNHVLLYTRLVLMGDTQVTWVLRIWGW